MATDEPGSSPIEDTLRTTLHAAATAIDVEPATERIAEVTDVGGRSRRGQYQWLGAAAAVVLLITGLALIRQGRTDSITDTGGPGTTMPAPGTTILGQRAFEPTGDNVALSEVSVPVLRFGYLPPGYEASPATRDPFIGGQSLAIQHRVDPPGADRQLSAEIVVDISLMPFPMSHAHHVATGRRPGDPGVEYRMLPVTNGLEWVATYKSEGGPGLPRGPGLSGGNEVIYIQIVGIAHPPEFGDELLKLVAGISIERWQPVLDVQKLDPSLPDLMDRCEMWEMIRLRRPEAALSPPPEGCNP